MARYSDFLGRRVEVQYRAGEILLPASGTFVGDSGRSIFLEQSFEQRGQRNHFRWEIPYQYIVRLQARPALSSSPENSDVTVKEKSSPEPSRNVSEANKAANSASAAAGAKVGSSVLHPAHRPKPA